MFNIKYTLKDGSLANQDPKTQIFYGVFSQNLKSVIPEAISDIYTNSRDLNYESFRMKIRTPLLKGLLEAIKSAEIGCDKKYIKERFKELKKEIDPVICQLIEDLNDNYNDEDHPIYYNDGEYIIIDCLDTDFQIIKSPYYTFAPACSPCVPNAGNIDDISLDCDYYKPTYCLGPDFFEDNKPPYKFYKVEDFNGIEDILRQRMEDKIN